MNFSKISGCRGCDGCVRGIITHCTNNKLVEIILFACGGKGNISRKFTHWHKYPEKDYATISTNEKTATKSTAVRNNDNYGVDSSDTHEHNQKYVYVDDYEEASYNNEEVSIHVLWHIFDSPVDQCVTIVISMFLQGDIIKNNWLLIDSVSAYTVVFNPKYLIISTNWSTVSIPSATLDKKW